jgi:hypothetical protein
LAGGGGGAGRGLDRPDHSHSSAYADIRMAEWGVYGAAFRSQSTSVGEGSNPSSDKNSSLLDGNQMLDKTGMLPSPLRLTPIAGKVCF